ERPDWRFTVPRVLRACCTADGRTAGRGKSSIADCATVLDEEQIGFEGCIAALDHFAAKPLHVLQCAQRRLVHLFGVAGPIGSAGGTVHAYTIAQRDAK